jgi:hypothetical protein
MARLRVLADGVCAQNLGILNSSQIRGIQQKSVLETDRFWRNQNIHTAEIIEVDSCI